MQHHGLPICCDVVGRAMYSGWSNKLVWVQNPPRYLRYVSSVMGLSRWCRDAADSALHRRPGWYGAAGVWMHRGRVLQWDFARYSVIYTAKLWILPRKDVLQVIQTGDLSINAETVQLCSRETSRTVNRISSFGVVTRGQTHGRTRSANNEYDHFVHFLKIMHET
jgi:hypothetical protein